MRLKLILPMLFITGVLSAQTVKDWFTKPSLAAASQVTERYSVQDNKFKTIPLVMLKASFGQNTPFTVNLLYDIPNTQFLTVEAIWQPIHQIGIHIGLQKMLFQYETTFAPYSYGIIGYSQASSYLGGYSSDYTGISSRSRDWGLVLQGSFWPEEGFSKFSYAVGVFNGNGYNFKDDNKAKDIHGRLIFQPNRNLTFTLGGMLGYYTPMHEDGPGHHHWHTDEGLACRRRITAGVWYDNGKLFVRSENVYGKTDGMMSDGAMVLLGYKFLSRLQLSSRVDRFQRDLTDPLSTSTKLDFCFTHFLTKDGTIYYAIQYGHNFFSDPNIPGTDTIMVCLNLALLRKF